MNKRNRKTAPRLPDLVKEELDEAAAQVLDSCEPLVPVAEGFVDAVQLELRRSDIQLSTRVTKRGQRVEKFRMEKVRTEVVTVTEKFCAGKLSLTAVRFEKVTVRCRARDSPPCPPTQQEEFWRDSHPDGNSLSMAVARPMKSIS